MIRILLVDDHVLFREGLAGLLRPEPDFDLVGQAGTAREAIQLGRQLQPDLILMDFTLPDGTGLDVTQAVLETNPNVSIVFLTIHEDDDRLFSAIRSGAKGYLLKNVPVESLLASLRGLPRGEAPLSPTLTLRMIHEFSRMTASESADPPALSSLTNREVDILRLLAHGATNQEIAARLVISENTVKNHVHNILEKLNVRNRREAARFAKKNHLGT